MKRAWYFLLIPLIIAWFALNGFGFIFKAGVPVTCALIIALVYRDRFTNFKGVWFIIAAFLFSAAGDWFLSYKEDSFSRFALGIGLYFFAHAGYLGYALANGKVHKIFTSFLLIGYLLLFYFLLYPAISDTLLLVSVLLYLLISCISLGAAAGVKLRPVEKWSFFAGITLILMSDTIIAFHEFTSYQDLNLLILPTYYSAHLLITFSVLKKVV